MVTVLHAIIHFFFYTGVSFSREFNQIAELWIYVNSDFTIKSNVASKSRLSTSVFFKDPYFMRR